MLGMGRAAAVQGETVTPAERLRALSELALEMARDTTAIEEATRVILEAVRAGGTIYACGNGGSMAQAQHFAAELTGRYKRERRPVPAVALGSNPAHLTAVANDYGHEWVFERELRALYSYPADVLVWLTTSGESASVLKARHVALEQGLHTVGIIGGNPEAFVSRYERAIRIPTTDTALCQTLTAAVLHSICEAIDEAIAKEEE